MKTTTILIIDDDPAFQATIGQMISALRFGSAAAFTCQEGARSALSESCDLILLDLNLPDGDGLSLLRKLRENKLSTPVVMVSGQGTIPEAVNALKLGAEDFLVKPVDIRILESVIRRTLDSAEIRRENTQLRELAQAEKPLFLGENPVVKRLLADAERIASSDLPVLLLGETGTGKQVLARFIHSFSPRAQEPFVNVNCAAITVSLFESELFGHEKGAFTGAYVRKAGKFELAGRGTLFLDEIGELPNACQAKLLTAVEDRVFERVGGTTTLPFKGRIITATNRDLDREVATGNFRKDLFFRLNGMSLRLPPLREHLDDLPIYIEHTLARCSRKYGPHFEMPTADSIAELSQYAWPGNIRELMNQVERAALFTRQRHISRQAWLGMIAPMVEPQASDSDINLQVAVDKFKREHILKIVSTCGGNQTEAAKVLGVGRSYLNRLLSSYRDHQ